MKRKLCLVGGTIEERNQEGITVLERETAYLIRPTSKEASLVKGGKRGLGDLLRATFTPTYTSRYANA